MIFASSSSVYGDHSDLPKLEGKIGNPLSPYALTKVMNERYAEIYNRVYNFPSVGLRYFNIFGPNQNPTGPYAAAIPLFMDAVLKGKSPFIGGKDHTTAIHAVKKIEAHLKENPDTTRNVKILKTTLSLD